MFYEGVKAFSGGSASGGRPQGVECSLPLALFTTSDLCSRNLRLLLLASALHPLRFTALLLSLFLGCLLFCRLLCHHGEVLFRRQYDAARIVYKGLISAVSLCGAHMFWEG
ncbi:hypothetical protein KC19_2G002600 [Ceratodon purpureus]|uniref:Uncharacterized protein n=1 Tax=Ceratodon purpureus TaxID=3225 RepID=A0A8T0IQJ1_CERPU|nr:hypothetical protein KC19_2G002600 [Ceratodon purpureus]